MSIGNLVCYPTQRIMILSNSQGLKSNYPFISFISFWGFGGVSMGRIRFYELRKC
jgi:hypothetical protein